MPAIGIRGELTTSFFLSDGTFLYSETNENRIVNNGIKLTTQIASGLTPRIIDYIQVGTGGQTYQQLVDAETGVPLLDDLGNPLMGNVSKPIGDGDEELFTFYSETNEIVRSSATGTFTISANFNIPLDVPVNEAGMFSGSQAGSPMMFAKQAFSNTIKMWESRRNSTLSTVTGTYIILNISWKIFFGRDPQHESLYDQDLEIVSSEATDRYIPG